MRLRISAEFEIEGTLWHDPDLDAEGHAAFLRKEYGSLAALCADFQDEDTFEFVIALDEWEIARQKAEQERKGFMLECRRCVNKQLLPQISDTHISIKEATGWRLGSGQVLCPQCAADDDQIAEALGGDEEGEREDDSKAVALRGDAEPVDGSEDQVGEDQS